MIRIFLVLLGLNICVTASAQSNRWQQRVAYTMDIDMDANNNRFTGTQVLKYYNNSPDQLDKLFYHLYFNAFQPGSSMDVRSLELGKTKINGKPDWDARVTDRISNLKPDEIGYQKIKSLTLNGVPQKFIYHETILEVQLSKPILPNSLSTLVMEFEAQVPLQIRRSGRDNPKTGVKYTMSQWYPKLCEYDYEGWHPTPYIAREFYGVWGDYDVNINIDKYYKLAGTGMLTNASAIGWGYDVPGSALIPSTTPKRMWKFSAKNVHDFVWAADIDYKHIAKRASNGTMINVVYNAPYEDAANDSAWNVVADAALKVLPFIEKNFGKYPYPQYSFIQGGDGGMEYPMATLIQSSNLGTVFHEWMHSWYQMMLGTNESLYPWMDEGFTSYAEELITAYYNKETAKDALRKQLLKNPTNERLLNSIKTLPENHLGAYSGYYALTKSGLAEPLSQHADHFNTNYAYSISSYSKGEIFMEQLGYIVGASVRDKILLAYYDEWKFKHPNPNDLMVIAQKVSGLQLDWYKMYWINTTKTIDYAVDSVWNTNGKNTIQLKRIGLMPMPVDVEVTFTDGTKEMHTIPLDLMFGSKNSENSQPLVVEREWQWTHPLYHFTLTNSKAVSKVEIDPSKRMADVEMNNNIWEK